jgi:glycosyltransferase involved in cell wall biosynthesis
MLHLFPSLHHTIREAGVSVVYNIHDTWLPRHLAEGERLRELWYRAGSTWPKRVGKAVVRRSLKAFHPDWLRPMAVSDVALRNTVFCSYYQQTKYLEAGLPEGYSRVIYNGMDTTLFDGDPSRVRPGTLRLLFVGRLVSEKGAHTAIAAVEELHRRGHRGVSLSIAGVPAHPWEYAEGLKARCMSGDLAGSLRWLGTVPNASLPDVYRAHDVLVFPSSHLEGLPMTLLEAMACGLAVVGSASGGNVELLSDGVNSLIVPPGNVTGLADALERLYGDAGLTRALAARGQQLVREKFAIEAAVTQTEQYLHEVIERHRHTLSLGGLSTEMQ